MFENIGGKIKTYSKVIAWVGIVLSVLFGIIGMFTNILIGIFYAVFGSLLSWVGSFFAYGFGEMVEASVQSANTLREIRYELRNRPTANSAQSRAARSVAQGVPFHDHEEMPDMGVGKCDYQRTPAWQKVEQENNGQQ